MAWLTRRLWQQIWLQIVLAILGAAIFHGTAAELSAAPQSMDHARVRADQLVAQTVSRSIKTSRPSASARTQRALLSTASARPASGIEAPPPRPPVVTAPQRPSGLERTSTLTVAAADSKKNAPPKKKGAQWEQPSKSKSKSKKGPHQSQNSAPGAKNPGRSQGKAPSQGKTAPTKASQGASSSKSPKAGSSNKAGKDSASNQAAKATTASSSSSSSKPANKGDEATKPAKSAAESAKTKQAKPPRSGKSMPAKTARGRDVNAEVDSFAHDADDDYGASTSPLLFVFALFSLACALAFLYLKKRSQTAAASDLGSASSTSGNLFDNPAADDDLADSAVSLQESAQAAPKPAKKGKRASTPQGELERSLSELHQLAPLPTASDLSSPRSAPPPLPTLSNSVPESSTRGPSADDAAATLAHTVQELPVQLPPQLTATAADRAMSANEKNTAPAPTAGTSTALSAYEPSSIAREEEASEPCPFETFVELMAAQECWNNQGQDVASALAQHFNLSLLDFSNISQYWSQKYIADPKLKRRYDKLEPKFKRKWLASA